MGLLADVQKQLGATRPSFKIVYGDLVRQWLSRTTDGLERAESDMTALADALSEYGYTEDANAVEALRTAVEIAHSEAVRIESQVDARISGGGA